MKKTTLLGIAAAGTLAGIGLLRAVDPQSNPSPPPASAPKEEGGKACGWGGKPGGSCPMGFKGQFGPHHGKERGHFGHAMALDRLLNLTDEQKEKVKAVMEAQKPKIQAIREEERAKVKTVMDEARKEIRPILTKEQQQVLDDLDKLEKDKAALEKK